MTKPIDVVLLNLADNVCVAARSLDAGTRITVGGSSVSLAEPIRIGHKVALRAIAAGEPVTKYGQTIGFAT
ncbi:MAG TPA: UxaA family hydrolase, partial [Pirellulales bacterium]